ncbi:MAG: LexA family transcriptional regulator [Ruminococcaceae bacterium]|nr:LexA family transcriptional regulator [Oscillospiraceae bacterium]
MSNIFSENLKKSRLNSGMKVDEIASSLGVSQQTYYNYESGNREPSIENIVVLAKLFGVSADYLFGMTDDTDTKIAPQTPIKESTIKVYEKIPAGVKDIDTIPYIDEIEVSKTMVEDDSFFGLIISDNSMNPEYFDGDTVVVKKQSFAENGDDVVVSINQGDIQIRRVQKIANDILRFKALNSSFESINVPLESNVRIYGVVYEMRRVKK